MIVPDASAVVLLLLDSESEPRAERARQVLACDPTWLVPEYWRVELVSAARGLWLGKHLTNAQASAAVTAVAQMVTETVPTTLLLPRMWELRSSLTTREAGYVAAAELGASTLVTADRRISKAGVARCPVLVL